MIKFISKRTFTEGVDIEFYDSELYKMQIGIMDGKPHQLSFTPKSLFYPNVIGAIEENEAAAVILLNNITISDAKEIDIVLSRIKAASEFIYNEALPFVNARTKELIG